MTAITNNTPRVILNGINDQSVTPSVAQPEVTPIHLPLFYLQTPAGPVEDVVLVMPGDLTRIYGDDAVDIRKPWFNHATLMATKVLEQGNAIFVKRIVRNSLDNVIVPAKSRLTLTCTVDATTPIFTYARDVNGGVILDSNFNPTFTTTPIVGGVTLTYAWIATGVLTNIQLNAPLTVAGNTLYYLLTLEADGIGDLGNNTGVRLWTAGINSTSPADIDVVNDQKSLLFNAQLVYRAPNTTPVITTSLFGETFTTFAFKPSAYSYKTNKNLTIQNLVTEWQDDGVAAGTSPTYGPVGKITVHESNLEALLTTLLAAENAQAGPHYTSMWMLDFLTGVDSTGDAHYGFQIASTSAVLTENYTYYLKGGSDGDLTNTTFDTAVISEINNNYQNPAYPLIDAAKYPFSVVYDSGFSIAVKKALFKWTSYRKDVHVAVGTHVVNQPQLTASEELSIGIDLRTAALLYGESAVWGTPACRIVLMMQSGILLNSSFPLPVSTVFDLAIKRAGYLGAGSGKMKSDLGYDIGGAKVVSTMKNLTNTFLRESVKVQVWLAALNYAQSFDMKTYFFPALQTVYPLQQSVLTGEILMQICCDVEKQSQIVWRLMSGNSDLSDAEFIKESDRLLLELVDGRYDNRVIISPNTYFTAADVVRGYSWVQDITVYGNVPNTVGVVNVITKRQVATTGA